MLSLFSTNQSHGELNFLFNFASIDFKSGPVNIRQGHSQQSWTCHLHIKEILEGKDPGGTPQVRSPGEEIFFNHILRKISHDLLYQKPFEDL